jgi:K+-transporting ATPase ATPase C chain
MKTMVQSLLILLVFTLLCGGIYPVGVWVLGRSIWPNEANGSLITGPNGQVIGSALIAQKFESDRYFFARPSAADYATTPSSASNLGPTSARLQQQIATRRKELAERHKTTLDLVPDELVTTSASGLDPELSVPSIQFQVNRVVNARSLSADQVIVLNETIARLTRKPQWGIFGEPRINVLELNLALDEIKAS